MKVSFSFAVRILVAALFLSFLSSRVSAELVRVEIERRQPFADGIADVVPPATGPRFEALVPQVDADGNELAGIRLPEIEVPVSTYTGWSLRSTVHDRYPNRDV